MKLTKDFKDMTAVIDTSALMVNPNIVAYAESVFAQVAISSVCIEELNRNKDAGRRAGSGKNNAWLAMMNLAERKDIIINQGRVYGKNDDVIIRLCRDLEREGRDVLIITDDIDFSLKFEKTITPADFLNKCSFDDETKNFDPMGATVLDRMKRSNWDNFTFPKKINLRHIFSDGLTLLIHAIRAHDHGKIRFLISQGADVNQTDVQKYFLTPLSHCVQANDMTAFSILVDAGADINKGSINETANSHIRLRNEGNTPLMIACWHGKKDFVDFLCRQPGLCLNQQDSNGYTAMMKSVIRGHLDVYKFLASQNGVDSLIRDRKNHDIKWWLENWEKNAAR